METMDFVALFSDSDDPSIHKQQIAGLRRAINGLAQDVDALKQVLRERQVLDPLRYFDGKWSSSRNSAKGVWLPNKRLQPAAPRVIMRCRG